MVLIRNKITRVWEPEVFAGGVYVLDAGFTMCLVCSRNFGNPFANQSVGDNELRFVIIAMFGRFEGIEELLHVLAIDFLDVESICLETCGGILALSFLRHRVESDGVAVVDKN